MQVWVGKTRRDVHTCQEWLDGESPEGDRVLLLLEFDADGAVSAASVVLGEGPWPDVEPDPDENYPPDPDWSPYNCPLLYPITGFEYPGHDLRWVDSRLEATFFLADFYEAWCERQTSYPAAEWASDLGDDYLCRPTIDISYDDAHIGGQAFGALYGVPGPLCINRPEERPCDCDADGCRPLRLAAVLLDVLVSDDTMQGALVEPFPGLPRVNEVRLRRER